MYQFHHPLEFPYIPLSSTPSSVPSLWQLQVWFLSFGAKTFKTKNKNRAGEILCVNINIRTPMSPSLWPLSQGWRKKKIMVNCLKWASVISFQRSCFRLHIWKDEVTVVAAAHRMNSQLQWQAKYCPQTPAEGAHLWPSDCIPLCRPTVGLCAPFCVTIQVQDPGIPRLRKQPKLAFCGARDEDGA